MCAILRPPRLCRRAIRLFPSSMAPTHRSAHQPTLAPICQSSQTLTAAYHDGRKTYGGVQLLSTHYLQCNVRSYFHFLLYHNFPPYHTSQLIAFPLEAFASMQVVSATTGDLLYKFPVYGIVQSLSLYKTFVAVGMQVYLDLRPQPMCTYE